MSQCVERLVHATVAVVDNDNDSSSSSKSAAFIIILAAAAAAERALGNLAARGQLYAFANVTAHTLEANKCGAHARLFCMRVATMMDAHWLAARIRFKSVEINRKYIVSLNQCY